MVLTLTCRRSTLLLLLVSVILMSGLPLIFANNVAQQFWLPGTADGKCHFQFMSLVLTQGHGVTGTIVASNPIYVVIVNDTDKQSLYSNPSGCDLITTMGLVNSGPTTSYYLDFTAPYSVTRSSPFWITFANVGSDDSQVTVNITTS